MTPFGAKLREMRAARGATLRQMADALQLSPSYLSALEHGRRGRPNPVLVQQVCAYFGVIWDDSEELARLARLSHPRIVIDTAGLSPNHTLLANLLARRIAALGTARVEELLALLDGG
ncbi:MAG: helix-turn-helix domain-containing protein [Alphaproteobacteria bacterium]